MTKESGPAHIRHYITRCSCGDFVTEGGGNCKRLSKREAATLMLEKLKTLPPVQALVVQVNGQVEKEGSEESEKKETKKKAIFFYFYFLTVSFFNSNFFCRLNQRRGKDEISSS